MNEMHLVKTPLGSIDIGKQTTFHVPSKFLKEAEAQIRIFLDAHQTNQNSFPPFTFQVIPDDGYCAVLLWPEGLYAAFSLTRVPMTLDAILAFLITYEALPEEEANGVKYTLLPYTPDPEEENAIFCVGPVVHPTDEDEPAREKASKHIQDAIASVGEAQGWLGCNDGTVEEVAALVQIIELLERFGGQHSAV